MLFVKCPLGLDMSLPIVVPKAPDVGELGEERTRELLQWRLQVSENVLRDNDNGPETNGLDKKPKQSHYVTLSAICSKHQVEL